MFDFFLINNPMSLKLSIQFDTKPGSKLRQIYFNCIDDFMLEKLDFGA